MDYQRRFKLTRAACVLLAIVIPFTCLTTSALAYSLNDPTSPVGKFFGVKHGDSYLLLGHGHIVLGRSPMPPRLAANQFPVVRFHDELYRPPGDARVGEFHPRDLGSPDNFQIIPYYVPAIVGLVFLAAGLNYWPPRLPATVVPSRRRGFAPIIPN